MSNNFYNPSANPITHSLGSSTLIRTEFSSISAGFDKLPTLTGNAYKFVVVDPTGAFLTISNVGIYGGGNNTTNAAYGLSALAANVSGIQSAAYGSLALNTVTTGTRNSAFGFGALQQTNSNDNSAFGSSAGSSTTGSRNSLFGSTTNSGGGNDNSVFGYGAGFFISSGANNALFGSGAGSSISTGGNNTLVGYGANVTAGTENNSIAIGYQAFITTSNQIVLGNASVTAIRGMADNLTDLGDSTHRLKSITSTSVVSANVASSVNYWNLSGSITTNRLRCEPIGTDMNIGCEFLTKGTGSFLFNNGSGAIFASTVFSNTGTFGVGLQLIGDGVTTPSKYIRVSGGIFDIIDHAYTKSIFKLTDVGVCTLVNKLYPSTDAAAAQSVCGLYANTGVPSNANGANGDIYFNAGGGAGTTIYQKRAGSWVGIV